MESNKTKKKFYLYIQNNSGGFFVYDNYISPYVAIEKESDTEANKFAEKIGIYFDGVYKGEDCECCGDRWIKANEKDPNNPNTLIFENINDLKDYVTNKEKNNLKKWKSFKDTPILFIYYDDGKKEKYL